jgi:hypothetical protein
MAEEAGQRLSDAGEQHFEADNAGRFQAHLKQFNVGENDSEQARSLNRRKTGA